MASESRATADLRAIIPWQPWHYKLQLLQAFAAHAVVFKHELKRRTHVNGQTLAKVIWNQAGPIAADYLFNNLRLLHSLDHGTRRTFPSGTSGNEALQARLNQYYRCAREMCISTMQMQLEDCALGKLLAHNRAKQYPTLRAQLEGIVLGRMVGGINFDEESWMSWCASFRVHAHLAPIGSCSTLPRTA